MDLTEKENSSHTVSVFWFRRDLRLNDNAGLYQALKSKYPVLPLFIFDSDILDDLTNKTDRRVEFIRNVLVELKSELEAHKSSLIVKHGRPIEIWKQLTDEFEIAEVYLNHDYEPSAINRDDAVNKYLSSRGIPVHSFKDQVVFEKDEIVKNDGSPYMVYTPYMKKWKSEINDFNIPHYPCEKFFPNFYKTHPQKIPKLENIGFHGTGENFPSKEIDEALIRNYHKTRDYPGINGTSRLSVHLRFGTVSIREMVRLAMNLNDTWLNELIWREFFMMILFQFPHVVNRPFREKYENINWRNDKEDFKKWCDGKTGFPIVDAGMRELNLTGYMHNRVRMIAANFLTKLLLIDWRWGEHYFAEKLLDYELSSNNGNWQWSAGCGCDAAPYFRIFNPDTQIEKFDPELKYVKKWVPEYGTDAYVKPVIDYKSARQKALIVYKEAIG